MTKRLLINFFGGPGIGKTVAATDLFTALKKNHIECEMPSEFARECVLEGNSSALKDQVFILGNQYHKILAAYQNCAVTVVDSPILLCAIYGIRAGLPVSFKRLVVDLHNQFDNINVLLGRSTERSHSMIGRVHSLTDSISVDKEIQMLLEETQVPYVFQSEIEAHGQSMIDYLSDDIRSYLADTEEHTPIEQE